MNLTNIVKTTGSFVQGHCPQTGVYINTWIVTDKCGNVSNTFTQTIYAQDVIKPTWVTTDATLDRTISCNDVAGLADAQNLFPVATDNSDEDVANIVKTAGPFVPSATCSHSGTYTNDWTVTDDCGNTSLVYTQTITIQDNTAPVWTTFPGELDVVLDCGNTTGLATAQAMSPVATDDCGGVTYSATRGLFVPGSCGSTGSFTNTWIATDECGNAGMVYSQVITIIDQTAPVVICPPSTAINSNDPILPSSTGIPIVTDDCDTNPTVTYSDIVSPGGCPGSYTISRTWSAIDACSNIGSCIQTINVQDVTPPVFVSNPAAQLDWCVISIQNAIYYAPTVDITPTRPDYYILNASDKSLLYVDPAKFSDNGMINPTSLIFHWRIDFAGATPHIEGAGQLSAYSGELRFAGAASVAVSHRISYWLEDACGNISTKVFTVVKINPRPEIIKNTY